MPASARTGGARSNAGSAAVRASARMGGGRAAARSAVVRASAHMGDSAVVRASADSAVVRASAQRTCRAERAKRAEPAQRSGHGGWSERSERSPPAGVEGGVSEASGAHPAWLMLRGLWKCFLQMNTMHFNPNTVPGPSPRRPNILLVFQLYEKKTKTAIHYTKHD